jgi:hypothetical protein
MNNIIQKNGENKLQATRHCCRTKKSVRKLKELANSR